MSTNKTVLVVEDDPATALILRRMLESAGYLVQSVAIGSSVVAMVRQHSPALVILDFMLPDLDGLAITRLLRAGADTRQVAILMLSAASAGDLEARALKAGANAFLAKPVTNAQEFLQHVKRILDAGGLPKRD